MKNLLKSPITPFASLLAVILLFSGCSINDSNTTTSEDLTDEELEVAGQIIAESLSDQKDGIFASLNDAFTLPSSNGFNQGVQASKLYSSAVFNAAASNEASESESNYSYTYDPATGQHMVSFSRSTNRPNFSKETSADLEYIYLNSGGDYIASPRIENEEIETIDYIGTRSGSIITPNQNSSYQREDQFMIQGLTGGAELLTIDGLHSGSGSYRAIRGDGTEIERDYELTVEFLDVAINNSTVETNGTLEKGVTGALAYEMVIAKTVNSEESIKTVNGTIEFNGDGTALLRFRNILEDFKIQLGNGDILGDDEFNGFVRGVNANEDTFTLFNGQTYLITGDTEFTDGSELMDLNEIGSTLENNIRVVTSGRFTQDEAGTNLVRSVSFNYEREDVEFKDHVESVDLENRSFTLNNGMVLFINDGTEIDDDDGLTSLVAVQSALAAGNIIEAEGDFDPAPNGTNVVSEVSFEFDEQEFESFVELVDTENSTFTLADGKTYQTNESTNFDDDITSIGQLKTVFDGGLKIKAEGEYYFDDRGNRNVIEVEFETENFEENEFEGFVEAVNSTDRSFTLDNGLVLFVNNDTKYEDDIRSFNELATEFANGERIDAEGKYYIDGEERNIVIKGEFELDDDDDSDSEREEKDFEDIVDSVDLTSKTITLENGLILVVTEESEFDDSDINSIEELQETIRSGLTAEAEGEYYTDEDGNNIIIEIDFELTGNRGNGDDDSDDSDDDGDDDDNQNSKEFEGDVASVNGDQFTLAGGQTYLVDGDTNFENDGDLLSLAEVSSALSNGITVKAEGDYIEEDNSSRLAISVKFETESDDDDGDSGDDDSDDSDDDGDDDDNQNSKEFEGDVASVNGDQFTLAGGQTYLVDGDTNFENDGDLLSLAEVSSALSNGITVKAEGDYIEEDNSSRLAISVKFETESDDDDGDSGDDDSDDSDDDGDDDDNQNSKEFEGDVASVNGDQFTLAGGQTYLVDGDTNFENDGDLLSLAEVSSALSNGITVKAEGDYIEEDNSSRLAISVKFETESDDDDGDSGDDDSDDSDDDGDDDDKTAKQQRDLKVTVFAGICQTWKQGDYTIHGWLSRLNLRWTDSDRCALSNGITVKAEGDYIEEDNSSRLATATAAMTIRTTPTPTSDNSWVNDIRSLSELADALSNGINLKAEGDTTLMVMATIS